MGKIPDEIISRIQDHANIVDEIGEDISLHKAGANYKGICPFHADHNASLYVNPAKGIYKCFACGAGGNVIKFRMEYDNLTFPEAVRLLGKKYNIEVPTVELTPERQQYYELCESTKAVLARANAELQHHLDTTSDALNYIASRGISTETAAVYSLGYAFDYNGLSKMLLKVGYKQEHIIAADIAYWDAEGNQLKDTFWRRIMFPFFDKSGQVVGFTGRAVNDQKAKYKNTGETCLFTKGKHLYGLYQAQHEIRKQDKVYVVEGQFDVLSFYEAGIKNVVAGSGTAFTPEQRKLLHGYTQNVVFVYDSDRAGCAAAAKHLPELIHDGFRVRCVPLPPGKDPNDLLKTIKHQMADYVSKHETGYVEFLHSVLLTASMDEYAQLEAVKSIVNVIANERDRIIRDKYIAKLSQLTDIDSQQLQELLEQSNVPETPEEFTPGFYGLDIVSEIVEDKDDCEIHLVNDFDRFSKHICANEPYIFYYGVPKEDAITDLHRICDRVVVHKPNVECDRRHECSDVLMMKELFKQGLSIDVISDSTATGFIFFYVGIYGDLISEEVSVETRNEYYGRCAEMISWAKDSIQTINIPTWANQLHIKPAQLKEILKPFQNERKSSRRMHKERNYVSDDLIGIDSDSLPDYVTENEEYARNFQRYGFYPVIRKSDGTPVCYMFRTENNNFRRVGDFYIEPLFHVYSKNKEDNRRVIRLNMMHENRSIYADWASSVFAKLSSVQEMLINEGSYNFENGTAQDYAKIWSCISYHFPKCTELKVFGEQPEGCFCFANGIFHQVDGEWVFEGVDELGLMRHGDDTFYSPAFSKVHAAVRRDDDEFEQDRWMVYTNTPHEKRITFAHWASLMDEVYTINNNGKWALLYAILCAFRSDIFKRTRIFTAPFFIGPTMSGKTQIAVSIRSLFLKPEAPSFNLNSGTDAAFFSILERFRDVPQIMEEYNDEMISDQKFQGLKSTIYDGESKQKRKSASSNDVKASKVNAPIVLLGQEAPQKDDNALTNRVILCEVPKTEAINTEHAKKIFEELKEHENNGLSYLLLQVLELRDVVCDHWSELYRICSRELQSKVETSSSRTGEQARLINTVSMFLTMTKLIERHAPRLALPFRYEEFLDIAVEKVKSQISMLVKTDKLAVFFNTIDTLIDQGKIKFGRDFKIVDTQRITISEGTGKSNGRANDNEIVFPQETKVLYMNLSTIHYMYSVAVQKDQRPLSLSTLGINLKSHPAFLGHVRSTRFRWQETEETAAFPEETTQQGVVYHKNLTMVRRIRTVEKQTSAEVLNYDTLRRLMNIDFERVTVDESN